MKWGSILFLGLFPVVLLGAAEGRLPDPVRKAETTGVGKTAFAWIPAEAPVPVIFTEGVLAVSVGMREVGGSAWRGLPNVVQGGISWTMGPERWAARPIVSYYHASGSGEYQGEGHYALDLAQLGSWREPYARGELSGDFDELAIGATTGVSWEYVRADIAGGASWVHAQLTDQPSLTLMRRIGRFDIESAEDSDSGLGWWASASVSTKVGPMLFGIEGRYTYAPLRIFSEELKAGGWQLGGSLGFSW